MLAGEDDGVVDVEPLADLGDEVERGRGHVAGGRQEDDVVVGAGVGRPGDDVPHLVDVHGRLQGGHGGRRPLAAENGEF